MAESHRHKVVLQILPQWAIYGLLLLFIGLSALAFVIGIFSAPRAYLMDRKGHTVDSGFFRGDYNITHDINGTSPLNQELSFAVQLASYRNATSGLNKADVEYGVGLYASNTGKEPFEAYDADNDVHIRPLNCIQDSAFCVPQTVVRTRFVSHSYFRASVRFTNLQKLYEKGFLSHNVTTMFTYVNPDYTTYEFVFRYLFIAITIGILIAFCIATFTKQRFYDWHSEQKWVLTLLVALIFYNNPLYPLNFYAGTWFFPLLNSVFLMNFIAIMLFVLIVMTHSALKAPQERTFLKFYLLKYVVIGTIWLLAVIVTVYEGVNQSLDGAYSYTDIPFFSFIIYALIAACGVYLLLLAYYVARLLGVSRTLPEKYARRFKAVWQLTFFVIVVSAVVILFVFLARMGFDAIFLFIHSIFTLYPLFLAIFYFPTSQYDDAEEVTDEMTQ